MKIAAALAALAVAACATTPSTTGAQLPLALQRVLTDYAAAWEMHDTKGLAALFTDDGRTVVPNACPPGPGRATIEKCYTSGGPLHLRALDHRIGANLAYIIGEYALNADDIPRGKFTLTLTNDNGRWFIVADMDQSYPPPKQAAQP